MGSDGTGEEHGESAPLLSVVIPAFNESGRIAASLAAVRDYLCAQPYRSEVVVVDDGSDDATFAVVCAVASDGRLPVRAFRYQPNAGKGYAIKFGVAQTRGRYVLFTDADLSSPIEETARMLAPLGAGADVVIGSRKGPGAEIVVHQPWLRERLGKAFTWLARRLIADVSDVTCGFKAFRAAAARDIFSRVRVYDWSFDAEILLLAARLDYRLVEVPVRWAHRPGSKVRLGRDVLRSLQGLARIRLNAARGRYARAHPVDVAERLERWESATAPAAVGTPTA
jgi:dolichyl-phosphate beta-glucosyltransferase